jgi:hypothetical protein
VLRKRLKFPLIGIAIGCVGLALLYSVAGLPMARHYPGLLTLFSFKDGPFSWSYEISSGKVGPFEIGEEQEASWNAIRRCGCRVYPTAQNLPYVEGSDIPPGQESQFVKNNSVMVSTKSLGSVVIYILQFDGKKLVEIDISSSLFDGL